MSVCLQLFVIHHVIPPNTITLLNLLFGLNLSLRSFTVIPLTTALPVTLTRCSAESCASVLMVTSGGVTL